MSLRATLILMWVFLVLGALWGWDTFHRQPAREEAEEQSSHLVGIKDKLLESISIQVPGRPAVRLECAMPEGCPPDGSARWKVAEPMEDKGDPSSIGSLASALLNLTSLEKIDFDGKPDPAEFGLGEAAKVMEVKLKGEPSPIRIEAGKATPVGPNVYIWTSTAPHELSVVASFFPQMLDKDLYHWRNKRLFPEAESEKVSGISWKGKTSVDAVKKDGRWRLTFPLKTGANEVMMDGLVSTLVYAAARSVYAQDRASPAGKKILSGKPVLELRFSGGQGGSLRLYPGPGTGGRDFVAALPEGPLYLVEAHTFDRFTKPLLEYRERRLFPDFNRAGIQSLQLKFPREKKEITLEIKEGKWAATGGEKPSEALSQERIRAFVAALLDSEADAFLGQGSQGARLLHSRPADLEIILKGDSEARARFQVLDRKAALTDGDGRDEPRTYGEEFLRVMPVRLQDLYESGNRKVISETKEENGHDHQPEPPGDGHHH